MSTIVGDAIRGIFGNTPIPDYLHWNASTHPCDGRWRGITCEDGNVTRIQLYYWLESFAENNSEGINMSAMWAVVPSIKSIEITDFFAVTGTIDLGPEAYKPNLESIQIYDTWLTVDYPRQVWKLPEKSHPALKWINIHKTKTFGTFEDDMTHPFPHYEVRNERLAELCPYCIMSLVGNTTSNVTGTVTISEEGLSPNWSKFQVQQMPHLTVDFSHAPKDALARIQRIQVENAKIKTGGNPLFSRGVNYSWANRLTISPHAVVDASPWDFKALSENNPSFAMPRESVKVSTHIIIPSNRFTGTVDWSVLADNRTFGISDGAYRVRFQTLDISNNNFTGTIDLTALFPVSSVWDSIQTLKLSANDWDADQELVWEAFDNATVPLELRLDSCKLSGSMDGKWQYVTQPNKKDEHVTNNHKPHIVDLSNNNLTGDDCSFEGLGAKRGGASAGVIILNYHGLDLRVPSASTRTLT